MDEEMKAMEDKMEDRKWYRTFTVTPGLAGFEVKIGCSKVYFSNARECANEIMRYMQSPQETEKDYQGSDHRLNQAVDPVPVGAVNPYLMPPLQQSDPIVRAATQYQYRATAGTVNQGGNNASSSN